MANVPDVEPRALAVPLGLLDDNGSSPCFGVLDRLGLRAGGYVLYPANFWRHKNHATLFEALRRYRARRRSGSDLVLVCTGVPNSLSAELKRGAPPGAVVFAGYVDSSELRALLAASRGLVLPIVVRRFWFARSRRDGRWQARVVQ